MSIDTQMLEQKEDYSKGYAIMISVQLVLEQLNFTNMEIRSDLPIIFSDLAHVLPCCSQCYSYRTMNEAIQKSNQLDLSAQPQHAAHARANSSEIKSIQA